MNVFNLSGEVIRHGVKGKQWPKLWVQVSASSPQGSGLNDNKLFINFDLDANLQSPVGKIGEYIKNKLDSSRYIFMSEVMVTKLPTSKKGDDGNWIKGEIIGAKGKVRNIQLYTTIPPVINTGFASGNVMRYNFNEETKEEKFIVGDRYRNVKTNEWKTRDIPVLRSNVTDPKDLTSKQVFVEGTLCGTSINGESKTFVWSNKIVVSS